MFYYSEIIFFIKLKYFKSGLTTKKSGQIFQFNSFINWGNLTILKIISHKNTVIQLLIDGRSHDDTFAQDLK
jgi:hypothetical protein